MFESINGLKIIEILITFGYTNDYCIYRYLKKDIGYSIDEFSLDAVNYYLEHYLTQQFIDSRSKSKILNLEIIINHNIIRCVQASRQESNVSNRRAKLTCAYKNCNISFKKRTSFYCNECKVGLHQECSIHFHGVRPFIYPTKHNSVLK